MEDKDSYCVWRKVPLGIYECDGEMWETGCGEEHWYPMDRFTFCPFCRRRINVLRPKEGEK